MDYSSLKRCRDNFGEKPRRFTWWDRFNYLKVAKPAWMRQNPEDKLNPLIDSVPQLFQQGTVVWGQVIQANAALFSDGPDNCPGEVVYSLADASKFGLEELVDVARQIADLKGTEPDSPDLAEIAHYLTDEYIRVHGLKVPKAVSQRLPCRISTTYFVRKHLPHNKLLGGILPIVVNPKPPHYAIPLPSKYWSSDLILNWL